LRVRSPRLIASSRFLNSLLVAYRGLQRSTSTEHAVELTVSASRISKFLYNSDNDYFTNVSLLDYIQWVFLTLILSVTIIPK